jgi:FAD/FMN-containing dehydrogenase
MPLSALPIDDLAARLDGDVTTPSDPDYDLARQVVNAAVDRRPLAIAHVAGVPDVVRVVQFARERDVPLAVRAGAHGLAGDATAEGGVVLDLGRLDAVGLDVAGRTGTAQAGVTAGAYTQLAGAHGLATGFGDHPGVGVSGLTLGGGIGFLVRKHGLTIDQLLGAEVVTAAGDVLEVDAEHHPDLFWALRGGGGNFGVVTRLRFRLHDVPSVVGGMLALPARPEVLAGLVEIASGAPDELSVIIHAMKAPPAPFLPADVHGRPVILAMPVFAGTEAQGLRYIEAMRALATPIVDTVRTTAYPEMFQAGGPERAAMAIRNGFTDGFGRAEAELVLGRLANAPAPIATTQIRVLGGAAGRVPEDATAFAHRARPMLVITGAVTMDPAGLDAATAWADGTAAALGLPASGAYVNYLSDDTDETVRRAYPPATLERLRAVKREYDPGNVFRLNRNVTP